jgi:hypothetical protein
MSITGKTQNAQAKTIRAASQEAKAQSGKS